MKKFRVLGDVAIAETAFEAYGTNLNLLFRNAALALTEVMVDTKSIETKQLLEIKLESENAADLLFRLLEELVFLKDSQDLLFKTFNIHVINTKPAKLTGELRGEKINHQKHRLRTDVKAVTYHMFEVKKEKKYWTAKVVVDV